MNSFDSRLLLEEVGGRLYQLGRNLTYQGRLQEFVVKAGFITDLASVPRFLQALFPRDGTYTRAAVLHDLLWRLSREYWGREVSGMVPLRDQTYPASYVLPPPDVDGLFRRSMRISGTGFFARWLMWWAVRTAAILTGFKGRMGLVGWLQWLAVPVSAGLTGFTLYSLIRHIVSIF